MVLLMRFLPLPAKGFAMTERIEVVYHIRSDARYIEARARSVAVEQSVEMPVEAIRDCYVLEDILGEVRSIQDLGNGLFEARIGLSAESTGAEPGQLMNMLFGNTSLQTDVQLMDADLPSSLLQAFGGPSQGLDGWTARLNGERRPLTCSNLKPQGLSCEGLAALAEKLALGGLDLIKDDHGLADQSYSPFVLRVPAIATAVQRASERTGVHTRYLPNVTGSLDQLRRQLDQVRKLGLDGVLILPMVVGLPAFHQARREYPDIAFMAHPALAGTLRIALPFLVGCIFRLLGADALVFPGYGGRFGSSREECRRLIDHARGAWGDLKPALPIPAGGMTPERVTELKAFYGPDSALFLGGSLLAAADRLTEQTAAFVEAVRRPFEYGLSAAS